MMRVLAVCAISLCLMAQACQTTGGGKGGSFCDTEKPTRLSDQAIAAMSDQEIRDAVAHNRFGAKECGWRP